jgi:hypothetical protein
MKPLPLLRCVERVPGGLMVVPLLVGAIIATFAPGTAKFFGAYSVMTIESGPFLTMVTLGVAGLSAFPWQTLLGALVTAWWAGRVGAPLPENGVPPERSAAAPVRREEH